MFHPRIISRILGLLLFIEAAFLLTSLAVALFYRETDLNTYIYSLAAMVGTGAVLTYIGRGKERNISRKDGYIVVTLCWIIFSIFGAVPYYLSDCLPSVTDAFFETMSGFSTTGATVLNDIESLPHSLLFWRAMTHWIGGLGIMFFTVAVFPVFGLGDINLFAAESVGPMRAKLHPRISVAARWILTIYIGLTMIATISFYFAGMGKFDAVCHAMSTIATGGFSTKQASIAAFNSPLIDYVVTLFMFLGGVNLSLLYLFLFKARFGDLFRDSEFRVYAGSVLLFTVIIAAGLFFSSSMGVEEAFRTSLFQVVSMQTTTGFATSNYVLWLPILWLMLSALMFLGACSGSTSGAMKCAGAAADVDHAAVAPVGGAQEGELRFPVARADLQFHLGFLHQALGELGLVAGIAGSGGGKEMHRLGPLRPGFPRHAAHGGQGSVHGGLAQVARCIQPGEKAGAFTVAHQAAEGAALHIDQQHSHRIGTNADGCSFHGLSS